MQEVGQSEKEGEASGHARDKYLALSLVPLQIAYTDEAQDSAQRRASGSV